jgi:hypothetical protein
MPLSPDQLRKAFGELNGKRPVRLEFEHASPCIVPNALLIPDEADHILKITDGSHIYLIDAERVVWIEIG